MFAQPSVAALNHLLTQNSWALQRLAHFAGKTARFDIAPFSFAYTILEDGSLREAAADVGADASCNIAPSLLPGFALSDDDASPEIQRAGDTALIEEIFFLARNLRWDAAEDLSHVTGDIAAERIMQAVQSTQQQFRDTILNLSQAASEYWTEEQPLLAKPQQVSAFMRQVDSLRDEAAELEQRIARLSATQKI